MVLGKAGELMLITTENINFLIHLAALGLLILISYYLIHIGNRFIPDHKRVIFNKKLTLKIVLYVGIIALVVYLFSRFAIFKNMLNVLVVAAIFAYLFNPLVGYFEKKNHKRSVSILITYLIIFGTIVIFISAIAPKTGSELKNFFLYLPKNVADLLNGFQEWSDNTFKSNPSLQQYFSKSNDMLKEAMYRLQANLISAGGNLSAYVTGALNRALNVVLVPVVGYYYLRDKEKIGDYMISRMSDNHRDQWLKLGREIDKSMGQFIRGRLLMAVFVGLATTVLLLIMRVNYAFVIGVITCIADIVPYIGPFLGFIPAVIIAFMQNPIKALWVAIIFVLIQWVENNIVGPKLLGESIGLHPLVVLLSLIIGGSLFGVLGMILSVPVVAILKIIGYHFFPVVKGYFSEE